MMDDYDLVIFDADGTLRHVPNKPNKPPLWGDKWELLPGVKERIKLLQCPIGIASNQACVGRGEVPHQKALFMLHDLMGALDRWEYWYNVFICPHVPADNCHCRKPKPDLLLSLMERNKAIPKDTLFVGDAETDRLAAIAAGCQFAWAGDFFGWKSDKAAWPDGLRRLDLQIHPMHPQALSLRDNGGQPQFVTASLILEYIRELEDFIVRS